LCFPAGEQAKTPETAVYLGRELAKQGFDKDAAIIALGGGVVGDLAGYVASFFMRGIPFIQIPTTLLAQVDSSVGGKTGVDIPEGKNLFGSFYQPQAVLIDVSTIKTLPDQEIANGFAEIIKYGMIKDAELFKFIEENHSSKDAGFFSRVIKRACEIKGEVVEQDEKEGELRKILNYGHTIGHAIESTAGYTIPHGEAVALGMAYEGVIAVKLGLLDKMSLERQNRLIRQVGLCLEYKGDIDRLIHVMKADKKSKDGKLYFVLPTTIGAVKEENGQVAFPVDEALVKGCLREPVR
jgi:3-dehydroquinate synthase